MGKLEVQKVYPLSPMQEGILFHSVVNNNADTYFQQLTFYLKGDLDLTLFEKSFHTLLERHEILRTIFVYEKVKRPQQVVVKNRVERIYYEDISHLSEEAKTGYIEEFQVKDRRKGFNLVKDALIRVSVLQTGSELYAVILSNHHILLDGWCRSIITKEFFQIYLALKTNQPLALQPVYPFSNYIKWIEKQDKEKGLRYWQNYLDGYEEQVQIPGKGNTGQLEEYKKSELTLTLDKVLTTQLQRLAIENQVTLNVLFQTLWGVLLQKYNHTTDVVFGAVVSGRPIEITGIDQMVGLFINTIPVRIRSKANQSFLELVKMVQIDAVETVSHSYYPLAEIQGQTELKRDLIDHIFVFENYSVDDMKDLTNDSQFGFTKLDVQVFEQTNYDFNIILYPGERLELKLSYNALVYEPETVKRVEKHLLGIIQTVIAHPEIHIKDLEVITPEEKEEILGSFNDTDADFPAEKTMVQIFEEQVERCPDDLAVLFQEQQLTYRDLNQKANQLARVLRAAGVKNDQIAGIMVERSLEMIIGIMAILKAGGAYLPIDPAYPEDRIQYMLDDSEAQILLTQQRWKDHVPFKGIVIDLEAREFETEIGSNLERINQPADLIYIIYTSGSTGKPKGVMIEHRSVINRLNWMQRTYLLRKEDRILQKTPFTFDVSVWELFWWMLAGSSVCFLTPGDEKEPEKIIKTLAKYQITVLHFVPSMLNAFLETIRNADYLEQIASVRKVFASGEALHLKHVELFHQYFSRRVGAELYNLYGPTEATVDVTSFDCLTVEQLQTVPIGKPIDNTQIYIVDTNNALQPIGVVGELCIGGVNLARGYLKRPELTAEKFVVNPFAPDTRMYRTGDLARWLPDGNIEYAGRIDQQVKVRGYRIELGEIEHVLAKHHSMKENVVIVREDQEGQKYLCAYIVADAELTVEGVREFLLRDLPDYMVPAYFVFLKNLPLSSNGKINRKALPEPDVEMTTGVEYVEPRSVMEEKLAEVWKEILRVSKVGIYDNFFALGGDSIKALQITSYLKKFDYHIEVRDLFQNPTIETVSKRVRTSSRKIDQDLVIGEVELTPVQNWFFARRFTRMNHFNQSVMLYNQNGFDEQLLKKVLTELLKHHDALRISYTMDEHHISQYNQDFSETQVCLEVIAVTSAFDEREVVEKEAERIQKSIDLAAGPLIKMGLFKTDHGDHLLITIHHLVVDGISWRILLEDLAAGYQQARQNEPIQFQKKTDSFKAWAKMLKEFANSKQFLRELDYWKQVARYQVKPLPKDQYMANGTVKDLVTLELTLSEDMTEKLLKQVNQAYHTEINDLLLTALAITVRDWTKDKVLFTLEGHGREEVIKALDITRTIGWFTSMFPVLLDLPDRDELGEQIKIVKETLRKIPNKGIGYGILRYLTSAEKKSAVTFLAEPEICFNYLGQFDQNVTTEVFELSPFATGLSVSPDSEIQYTLSISGKIIKNQLTMAFTYNQKEYARETIRNLLENYQTNLQKLINHCVVKEKPELTPSDLGDSTLMPEDFETILRAVNGEIESIYDLSPMQRGILFHSLLNRGSAYFQQLAFEMEGKVDPLIFEASLNQLMERYEILRTTFIHSKLSVPKQVVLQKRLVEFHVEEISHLPEEEQKPFFVEYKKRDRERQFDLSRDSLIRASILQTTTGSKVIWSYHHILMDGWCLRIVMQDFFKIYSALMTNTPVDLNKPIPYKKYIDWLQERDQEETSAYWEQYLAGYEHQATLPKLQSSEDKQQVELQEFEFTLEPGSTAKMQQMAKEQQVTLSTLLQTIWGLLLQRYNNTDDVVFGSVVSGRDSEVEGIEQMVGVFINTIPVRVRSIDSNQRFSHLLKQMQEDVLQSQKHNYYPLYEIQTKTILKQNLLDHILIFQNYPEEEGVKQLGFQLQSVQVFEQTNYDFALTLYPGEEIQAKIRFNPQVYGLEMIQGLQGHWTAIVRGIVENSEWCMRDLEILTAGERERLLGDFNDTWAPYPSDLTIQELFEAQAAQRGDQTAVIFRDEKLTYAELNAKANQLARSLREQGVAANHIVALLVDRSVEMISGILGILKAGAAYLPLDPTYPKDRIAYMLEDSAAQVLVTRQHLSHLAPFAGRIIDVNDAHLAVYDISNVPVLNKPSDLAYVIYTSGSTGKPKGVLIEHRGVNNFIEGVSRRIDFSPGRRILGLTTISFDIFVLETLLPLAKGLTVILGDEREQIESKALSQVIRRHQVQMIQLTPSRLQNFLNGEQDLTCLQAMQAIILGGEALPEALAGKLRELTEARIYNMYGPTETTVWSSIKELAPAEMVTIGRPIANTQIYILDTEQRLQPVGVAGELCIGGEGLARGYLNRPELTGEKFIPNPFLAGTKLYRTGDLARWLPTGEVQFLGRIDQQVKIRGYRIEPEEIEAQLLHAPSIQEAAVVAKADRNGVKYLAAYFVAEETVEISDLRTALNKVLPEYMVPTYLIQLKVLPLTPNGKINRNALPEPEEMVGKGTQSVAPANEREERLVEIWKEVLEVETVGVTDHFFELGGHSLRATTLVARIHKEFDVEFPLEEVFRLVTIQLQAEWIKTAEKNSYTAITPVDDREYYPVSSAQKRFYALYQLNPTSVHYNMPVALTVQGSLDVDRLERTFQKMIQRHEILRTRFDMVDEEIVQRVLPQVDFCVELLCDEEILDGDVIRKQIRPFDLHQAPLFRVRVIRRSEERHLLFIDMHHIISDAASLRIFVKEFITLYAGEQLPDLVVQYRDYAIWQRERRTNGDLQDQEAYWLERFKGPIPRLELPTDYPRPVMQSVEGDQVRFTVDQELTKKLKELSGTTGATMYMILLSAYNLLLSRYSGQDEIIVGTPVAGRPVADLAHLIGVFINTLAMRNRIEGNKRFREFLLEVKANAVKAFENQEYPFEELVRQLQLPRDPGRHVLFDVAFEMFNFAEVEMVLEEIVLTPCSFMNTSSKFDLTLAAMETEEGLTFGFEYSTRLFKKETIERLAEYYQKILTIVGDDPEIIVSEIQFLSEEYGNRPVEMKPIDADFNF